MDFKMTYNDMGAHLEKPCEAINLEKKRYCKCSKTTLKRPLVERCRDQMKVKLNESKKNSKSKSSWKFTKEFEQGVDRFKGWNVYKTPMVFEKVGV